MVYKYRTKGTCSRSIEFELNDGIVGSVRFEGGCNGNLKGIASLVNGMKAEDVIARCEGISCGFKKHVVSRPACKSSQRSNKRINGNSRLNPRRLFYYRIKE